MDFGSLRWAWLWATLVLSGLETTCPKILSVSTTLKNLPNKITSWWLTFFSHSIESLLDLSLKCKFVEALLHWQLNFTWVHNQAYVRSNYWLWNIRLQSIIVHFYLQKIKLMWGTWLDLLVESPRWCNCRSIIQIFFVSFTLLGICWSCKLFNLQIWLFFSLMSFVLFYPNTILQCFLWFRLLSVPWFSTGL